MWQKIYNKDIIVIGTSNIIFVDDSWKIDKKEKQNIESKKKLMVEIFKESTNPYAHFIGMTIKGNPNNNCSFGGIKINSHWI